MKTKFKPNIGKGPGGRSSRPQGQSSAASRSKKDEAPSTQKDTSSEKADAVVVESRQDEPTATQVSNSSKPLGDSPLKSTATPTSEGRDPAPTTPTAEGRDPAPATPPPCTTRQECLIPSPPVGGNLRDLRNTRTGGDVEQVPSSSERQLEGEKEREDPREEGVPSSRRGKGRGSSSRKDMSPSGNKDSSQDVPSSGRGRGRGKGSSSRHELLLEGDKDGDSPRDVPVSGRGRGRRRGSSSRKDTERETNRDSSQDIPSSGRGRGRQRGSSSQQEVAPPEGEKEGEDVPSSAGGRGRGRRSRSRTGSGSPEVSEEAEGERRTGTKRKRASPNSTTEAPNSSTDVPNDSMSPGAKRQRVSMARVREAPNRSTMTMQELIYYNPTANPMSSKLEERKKKKAEGSDSRPVSSGATPVPADLPGRDEGAGQDPSQRRGKEGEEEGAEEDEGGRLVPQLTIGADGNIVIDEASMVVETTHQLQLPGLGDAVEEGETHTTSASYRKRSKITKWTKDETGKFFKALGQVGTDFTMMTLLLPSRSRKELKNKFKKEERISPHLIAQALKSQQSITQRTSAPSH